MSGFFSNRSSMKTSNSALSRSAASLAGGAVARAALPSEEATQAATSEPATVMNSRRSTTGLSLAQPKLSAPVRLLRTRRRHERESGRTRRPRSGSGRERALLLRRVRGDQIHEPGRQAVVRLELQLLQARAHLAHARRREARLDDRRDEQIGRASCRERV